MSRRYKHTEHINKEFEAVYNEIANIFMKASEQKSIQTVGVIETNKMIEGKIYLGKDSDGNIKMRIKHDGEVKTLKFE